MNPLSSPGECRLLGGAFASFIQVCLATLCIGTLAFKRYGEVPQRPWVVWALDVGKQSVGSSFGHFSNIFLSEIIATAVTGGDECQWYCLSFVLDSTLGTFVNLSLLNMVENFIRKTPSLHYLTFGDYGDPPSLVRWTAQLGIWLTLVITGKVVCVSILLEFSTALENAISFIFQDLKAHPQSELIVVMIIIPGILNVVSFWITDTFLKENGASHEQIPLTDLDEDLLEMGTVNEGELVLISNGSVRARPIAVPQKRIPSSTTSLASPADASPSSTQSIWQSASSAIPDILTSLSSRVSGPSNGINLTSSLEHVTEDEDDL